MESAGELLPWILPHLGAIASDLSVFHRIDDPDDIGMPKFVRLLEHLTAYNGAYLVSLRNAAQRRTQTAPAADAPDRDTSDAEIAAQWDAVLAREFPDHYGQGIETVSAEEMVRLASG